MVLFGALTLRGRACACEAERDSLTVSLVALMVEREGLPRLRGDSGLGC